MTRYLLLFDSNGLVFWGALSDERTAVFFICCWPSPAKSLSGPSSVTLVTIFYCLRFETSLSVASYASRGYGGSIRPRLHTGLRNNSSLHVPLYRLPGTMENVCCHGNMLTEPLSSNGLVHCYGNMCLAIPWLALDFRSGSAIPAFRSHVTVFCHVGIL
jgi:hypothetical protein